MMKYFVLTVLVSFSYVTSSLAQSGTNSPYSQYGLGKLSEQSTGLSRGMNGVGIAFREHNHVNYLNPASYSCVDSLTFIFDIAMSLQKTNFKENGKSKNANNGDFEYAVATFRAMKNLGISFGLMPYTNVGYNYSSSSSITVPTGLDNDYLKNITSVNTFSGSGGLHQIYIGAGWSPVKSFSVGVNVNYLFGNATNEVDNTFSDTSVKPLTYLYYTRVNSLKLDFGVSYTHVIDKKRQVTVGLTYTPGHKLGTDSECSIISGSSTSVRDTTVYVANNAFAIPTQFGIGLSYKYGSKWLLGFDYTLQKWASIESVAYVKDGVAFAMSDAFSNRYKVNFGGQYCQDEYGRSFMDRLRYRFGIGYSSSYLKINGKDGPSEFSLSAGVGIPIMNGWNSRSILNVGVQWQHANAKQLVRENTFLINVGITFNEAWFKKWKFD